jgi:hypothetical protein
MQLTRDIYIYIYISVLCSSLILLTSGSKFGNILRIKRTSGSAILRSSFYIVPYDSVGVGEP